MKRNVNSLVSVLLVSVLSTGCIGPWAKSDGTKDAEAANEVVNAPVDVKLDSLKKTEIWYKAIESIRITAQSAEAFADAALTAGKISQVEHDAVFAIVRNLVKPGLRVANSELMLFYQDATTGTAVEQKIAKVRIDSAKLDALTVNLKGRQLYEHAPPESATAVPVAEGGK